MTTTTTDTFTTMTTRTDLFRRATAYRDGIQSGHEGRYVPARVRLHWARWDMDPRNNDIPQWHEETPSEYNGRGPSTTWRIDDTGDHDGFTVYVTTEIDLYPDYSHLGEFTDRWSPTALDVTHYARERNGFNYFEPAESYADIRKSAPSGMSRHDTDVYARWRILSAYYLARNLESYIVTVRAVLNGRVWGETTLGGLDVEDGVYDAGVGSQLRDMVFGNDMIAEAVDAATEAYEAEMRRFLERRDERTIDTTTATISCSRADFDYGTLRVMGHLTTTEWDTLETHALHCTRPDWNHALPTDLWGSVKRRRAWAEWVTEQLTTTTVDDPTEDTTTTEDTTYDTGDTE
jgi:hypothetical protein